MRQTISLGILSLALAITVWFFVIDVENEGRTDFFPAAIQVTAVNDPEGLAGLPVRETVRVRIRADEDVWDSLSVDDFEAIVDLASVTQREATVPVSVSVRRGDVAVVNVEPSRLTVRLDPRISRDVPVETKIVGVPPQGYRLDDEGVSPETVSVSGPETLVNLVDAAVADVNLTGVRVSLNQDLLLTARDEQGGEIVGVNVDPNTVEVDLTILKEEFTVTYIVNPSISGNVAPGYTVTDIEVEPAFIGVIGPLEVLQSIETVETENVAVDGAESDVVRSVKLRLPEGASTSTAEDVIVTVRIAPSRGEMTFSVPLQTTGAEEGAAVTLIPPVVSIAVSGEITYLETLSGDRFAAIIDVSGLPPGTHTLAPKLELPANVDLLKVDPAQVTVTIAGP